MTTFTEEFELFSEYSVEQLYTEYPVENLHNNYTTEEYILGETFDTGETQGMEIRWNENCVLLSLRMAIEIGDKLINDGLKRNCMWVEELNKQANWETGKEFSFHLDFEEDCISFEIEEIEDDGDINYGCHYINKDGMLMVRNKAKLDKFLNEKDENKQQQYKADFKIYEECNCIYNDKVRC
jgi:hypothetical protein